MPLVKKPKAQLDKAAWAWVDTVEPSKITEEHIETAYRLNLNRCSFNSCKRNCRGNPFCLSGLGESKWLADTEFNYEEDEDLEVREPNAFVGLKNLGATCYVNSLLQLWFHNLAFREAILLWNPSEELQSYGIENEECGDGDSNGPKTIVGHLQLLFALMQFSKQKSIDPSGFIKCLALEPSMQQDAQEFSKLFMSVLEESVRQQSNPLVKNLVYSFRGEYSYITRCSICNHESVRSSYFYELELNVKNHKTIDQGINEFLQEEKLDGPNKYSCAVCKEKQDAIRFIRLEKLPPVLNLQLMRFIYDREKGHKKKLNTAIQFPNTLDMSIYLKQPQAGPCLYDLTAVLIHSGPSAYSGHYIAHICDQTTRSWYKFNDEQVLKMQGKDLKLGSSDDDCVKKAKQIRLAKGYLASSNAYMLVYTAQDSSVSKIISEDKLQPHLQNLITSSNQAFELVLLEQQETLNMKKETGKAKKAEITSILNELIIPKDVKDGQIVSLNWIIKWLANTCNQANVEEINNSQFMCIHGKLSPDFVTSVKYVSNVGAEKLYEKYQCTKKLGILDSMCKDCVVARCKHVKLKNKIMDDSKIISALMKVKESTPCYWVGKKSLKTWRQKALRLINDKCTYDKSPHASDNETENGHLDMKSDNESNVSEKNGADVEMSENNDADVEMSEKNSADVMTEKSRKRKLDEVEVEDDGDDFNDEIICVHGKLVPYENERKLVSENVWQILKYHFPKGKEFITDTPVCDLCLKLASEDEQIKNQYKELAAIQKSVLHDLLIGKNRPKLINNTFYIVSANDFLRPLKRFIRENGRMEPLVSVRNASLICQHGLLNSNLNEEDEANNTVALLNHEWDTLSQLFSVDQEIQVTYGPENMVISSEPGFCKECWDIRKMPLYDRAKIYIRPVNKSTGSSSPETKRIARMDEPAEATRRSKRHRKLRGEKEVVVSSTDTVSDLRMKIWNSLGIDPTTQKLSTEDGRDLTDLKATLASLNIYPLSVILLQTDEHDEDTNPPVEEFMRRPEVEKGFKGTALQG